MDRFKEADFVSVKDNGTNLHSSMDRFKDGLVSKMRSAVNAFTFQYG